MVDPWGLMFRVALLTCLLVGCAAQGDPLQQDMIANPAKYAPRPGTYRLPPDELPARTPAAQTITETTRTEPTRLTSRQQSARLPVYQQAVADQMLDPGSVQFRNVRLRQNSKGEDVLCGELNAKNGYGGYVGFDSFYAELITSQDFRRTSAVPFMARQVGLEYVLTRCSEYRS